MYVIKINVIRIRIIMCCLEMVERMLNKYQNFIFNVLSVMLFEREREREREREVENVR